LSASAELLVLSKMGSFVDCLLEEARNGVRSVSMLAECGRRNEICNGMYDSTAHASMRCRPTYAATHTWQ